MAPLAEVVTHARAMASAIYTFHRAATGDKMPRVIWMRRLLLLLVLVAVAGCSTTYQSPPPRASVPPRTRCLSDPGESGGTRPLFFLFCVESP
jgi:hypothetical protein